MKSRLGNKFTPPKWFTDSKLPVFRLPVHMSHRVTELPKDITLDGELFTGRGNFQDTVSIVRTINSKKWKGVTFQVCLSSRAERLVLTAN